MQVRDGMSRVVLTVGPGHTLREAARLMAERKVGAAVVIDPERPGPGIITERDLLESLGRGEDPDTERVGDHLTSDIVYAAPDWSLEEAAGGDGPRRLPPPGRHRGRRGRRRAVDARHRALLDRRRRICDVRRAQRQLAEEDRVHVGRASRVVSAARAGWPS